MKDGHADVSRRGFLRTAAGGSAVAVTGTAAGTAAGQEGGRPDFGGYLDDVGNYDGTVEDLRGEGTATVEVGAEGNGGNFAFEPPVIQIDAGTTVEWEWTGLGGGHNVVHEEGEFDSGDLVSEEGVNFEQTFEETGLYAYYCDPHEGVGMKGGIIVGDEFPTASADGGGGAAAGPELPASAKSIGVAAGFAMVSTLGMAYFFIKYGGDYGEVEQV